MNKLDFIKNFNIIGPLAFYAIHTYIYISLNFLELRGRNFFFFVINLSIGLEISETKNFKF